MKNSFITVLCSYCGKKFEKRYSEYKRSERLNKKHYCSLNCVGKLNSSHLQSEGMKKKRADGLREAIRLGKLIRTDKYTGFREYLKRIRSRKNNKEKKYYDIDLDYLIEIWEKQNGKCAYTGITLIHPSYKGGSKIYTASLDRIDSKKGYIKGNVQFVTIAVNLMKSDLSDEETKKLISMIKNGE